MRIVEPDTTQFTLKFGGEQADINASTYGTLLLNTVVILEETNKQLNTGAHLEIKVKTERKGSFLVDLSIEPMAIAAVVIPLMTQENIQTVKNVASRIIKTATSVHDLWKKLKGEKPKEVTEKGENVVVITGDNNTVIVDKSVSNLVFHNKRNREALANNFTALNKDKSVTDFSILDYEENVLFESEQSEFPALAKKIQPQLPAKKNDTEAAQLHIIRQSFDSSLKSDYLYRGIQISASITDAAFWEAINQGERYGKGDVLVCDLEIEREFIKALNTYENKSYTIIKVSRHIPRDEQESLFQD